MTYTLNWLIERYGSGEKIKYIFFWGHQPKKDGSIYESCFSQWWESSFEVDGMTYKTAEHWMMAQKARLFNDTEIAEKIIGCKTPAEAKKLGREIKNFDSQIWNEQKYDIVKTGNYHKFSQNEALLNYLLQTGNSVLVEASPVDNIWGIGMAKNEASIENPATWKGENLLGFALMEVRDELGMKS